MILNIDQIKKLIPHRKPFLFIEECKIIEEGKIGESFRTFYDSEYFFEGHFPDNPIVPGVVIIEAMAQTCGILGSHIMKQAASEGCDLVVFTELALTTFFPRYFVEDRAEMDRYFEKEMPSPITQPLFEIARKKSIGFYLGYGEITPDGLHYNTAIMVDKSANIIGKYRKVHLPGHVEFDSKRTHQHLEKRYFLPGDLGFKAWKTMNGIMGMAIDHTNKL
mgnify:CR=1 FL=1